MNSTLADPNGLLLGSTGESGYGTATLTYGVAAFATTLLSLIAIVSYQPRVHEKSPAFTRDTSPIIGSLGFLTRQWSFWKSSTDGLTKNFSFWLGSRHVVGITGQAARRMFYDNPDLCFVSQAIIQPFGVHFLPPVHAIFKAGFHSGHNNTFFLRRLMGLMKTEELKKVLPNALSDVHGDLESLVSNGQKSSVTSAPDIWRTVFKQNARLTFCDEVVDDAKLFERCAEDVGTLLHTYSHYNVLFSWLPAPSYIKRRLARRDLVQLVTQMVNQRIKENTPSKDDPLQRLINNRDNKEHIIEFFVSILFISTTNGHAIAGQLLNIMAIHPEWQEKIYQEIKAAVQAHGKFQEGTLAEKLRLLPLEAWETSFPTINMCLKETIRMWTSFTVTRLNTSSKPIPIPDTDEVVPAKTFVIYNSTEVNFSEKLYPNPTKFDPERYNEHREEFKKETYGFLGWGQGCHACVGMRWAKLQQTIIVATALAMYQWSSCDANGEPDPYVKHRRILDSDHAFHLPPAYCKVVPREVW
ncbi:putative Cytochrome P450 oxidoreductase [Cladophialophora carrionii]|uniref:Putative Cytochrome P450 oxidoreductase n=1 Tax=Cladophialophora carrionii TaxID=86049 RepID=A0A1C1CNA6_9EURO|nr:putative Cytochrome P450 oxidoreductase [Cladophialophora carrionii]